MIKNHKKYAAIHKLKNYEDDFENIIKNFLKYIKIEIKNYDDNYGLEDYKLHTEDYNLLLYLYENTNSDFCKTNKLILLLYYIYSYYKLDSIDYSIIPHSDLLKFMNKNNILHKKILEFIINDGKI